MKHFILYNRYFKKDNGIFLITLVTAGSRAPSTIKKRWNWSL